VLITFALRKVKKTYSKPTRRTAKKYGKNFKKETGSKTVVAGQVAQVGEGECRGIDCAGGGGRYCGIALSHGK
jgi:hypothetical protein